MKKRKNILRLLIGVMIIVLSGCNLPTAQTAGTPDLDATVAARVDIEKAAQTMVAKTMGANSAVATQTNTTQAQPEFTTTPSLTSTITMPPTIALISTPEGVFLTVSSDTYCRFGGPYSAFKILDTVRVGQKVEVLARNPENDSYFVKSPNNPSVTCWLYGKYATLAGNTTGLAVSTMHPTPTPTATPTPSPAFTVSYSGIENCGALYAFKLFIKNTGSLTWQYISLVGTDTITSFAINQSSNVFKEYSGCSTVLEQADLTPGEQSFVLNVDGASYFDYNPAGHPINVTVTLCTQDGGGGTCKSIPISFTP